VAEETVRAVVCRDHQRLERQLQSFVVQSNRNDPIARRVAWGTFGGVIGGDEVEVFADVQAIRVGPSVTGAVNE
jgi:hypothetical protein